MIDKEVSLLKNLKSAKIAFCKKNGLPIPAFDEVEDFFPDERIPCPNCGSKDGYIAKGVFTHLYNADGRSNEYTINIKSESKAVKCVRCNMRFSRERLWKKIELH